MSPALSELVTMPLDELLRGIAPGDVPATKISGLTLDSREVRPGELFLACRGQRQHGVRFVAEALARGAAAVAWEPQPGLSAPLAAVPVIAVPGLGRRVGALGDRFYRAPSAALEVAGVTGTNGKTTCALLIASAATRAGRRCGFVGTLGSGLPGALAAGSLTTPDALSLQRALASLRAQGAAAAAIEVSSHALDQGRVDALRFDTAVFTNLSRDHLDYHGDLQHYAAAKAKLFVEAAPRRAVINLNDRFGRELAGRLHAGCELVGVRDRASPALPGAELVIDEVLAGPGGLELRYSGSWGAGTLRSTLRGRFNAENLSCVLAVLLGWGLPVAQAVAAIGEVAAPPGRMEAFGGDPGPLVVVDYAHTPEALAAALRALREHCAGALWCVFGCGGERDPGKRPLMGAAAEALADHIVLTDDNPRGEEPAAIVADIVRGLSDRARVQIEHARGEAIALAIRTAGERDVVLVAGKGHEDYQLRGDARVAFSDRDRVRELLEARR